MANSILVRVGCLDYSFHTCAERRRGGGDAALETNSPATDL